MTTEPAPVGFDALGLDASLLAPLEALGILTPTPIQAEAIPHLIAGHDIIGRARTGSGKTAAFGLPMIQRVAAATGRGVRGLVLAPTRELALQVTRALRTYAAGTDVRVQAIYGGTAYHRQLRALQEGVPVVVGTPGRLLDHIERGTLDLSGVEMLVIDEADEMLRMGFIDDVEAILAAASGPRQVALFSATMPDAIKRVAMKYLKDAVEVQVESGALTVTHIAQRWMLVPDKHKPEALARILAAEERGSTLVFARTRVDCTRMADLMAEHGLDVDALHGDMDQTSRERVLGRLRDGKLDVVVATDVASRGIDVGHLTHVINVDFPENAETYVHRVGRTGRAGRAGSAITFVTPPERWKIRDLQRRLRVDIAPMEVPSDAQIARRQQSDLAKRLTDALEDDNAEDTRAWVSDLVAFGEWTMENVAVAAMTELVGLRRLSLERSEEEQPPPWARTATPPPRVERPQTDRPHPDRPHADTPHIKGQVDTNAVEIFLAVGSKSHVRPADIVGALANETGISSREIGAIRIFDRKTFVGVTQVAADTLLAEHHALIIRGQTYKLSVSHRRLTTARPPAAPNHRPRPTAPKGPRKGGPPR